MRISLRQSPGSESVIYFQLSKVWTVKHTLDFLKIFLMHIRLLGTENNRMHRKLTFPLSASIC
jgi:hypothetical protein